MKQNIALGSSVIAIVISIIAICVANPSKPELGFDYQGILIGILSLLTTVLLAFVGGSYFLKIKMINKKIEDISNENNHAIAESMFYEGYRGMTNTSVDYDKFITSLKTSVAAINLHFSEEKAELIYEVIKDYLHVYKDWGECIIIELEKIKYRSPSIDKCIKLIRDKIHD